MFRRPPVPTRPYTLSPYTTLFLSDLDIGPRHEEDDGLNLARPLKAGAEQGPVCIVGAARDSLSAAQLVTVAGQYCFSALHVAARHEGARVRIPDIRLRLCWEEREMESEADRQSVV